MSCHICTTSLSHFMCVLYNWMNLIQCPSFLLQLPLHFVANHLNACLNGFLLSWMNVKSLDLKFVSCYANRVLIQCFNEGTGRGIICLGLLPLHCACIISASCFHPFVFYASTLIDISRGSSNFGRYVMDLLKRFFSSDIG